MKTHPNPTPIRFPQEIAAKLKLVAMERNIPKNRLVVIAVKQYLAQIESLAA